MKKKLLILLSLLFFTPFVIKAEELKIDWQKDLGGNGNDQSVSAVVTEDGGFILLGLFNSTDVEGIVNNGEIDTLIIKYDKDGNMLWQKSWGGNDFDIFSSIASTEDGGFIIAGEFSSIDIEGMSQKGSGDAALVKYDKDGNMLWQKSWGGTGYDSFSSIVVTNDGGFVVIGISNSDIDGLVNKGNQDAIILKYDRDGNLLWQNIYGGTSYESFINMAITEDNGIIVVGNSSSKDIDGITNKGGADAILVKYDKDGNMLWQKNWGGNKRDDFISVAITEKGEIIAVGDSSSNDIEGLVNNGSEDGVIVKYDKDGNVLWQKNWGGSKSEKISSDIKLTRDDGFIIVGNFSSNDIEGLVNKGSDDAIILKYDKNGDLSWIKEWGGTGADAFVSITAIDNNNFIVTGRFSSKDIEGISSEGIYDIILNKYSVEYDLEIITTEHGTSTAIQQGKYGIITPTPNEGYEVDKIIIKDKDGNVLDVETTKQEDGTYSFDLYTDVSVEVIYKEAIENPKTGILDIITIIFIGFAISVSGFFIVKRYNERFEF